MKAKWIAGVLCLPVTSQAAIILDGIVDVDYGAALAVQTVQTQFGDNFSELNAAYAKVSGGVLHLMFTGNLENNLNTLNIFIDSVTGGQNVIGGTNPAIGNWGANHAGMKFDAGFSADYILVGRGNSTQFNFSYGVIGTTTEETHNIFSGTFTGISGALGTSGISVGFNNSNLAGITGGNAAADQTAAQAVTTGIDYFIPLSAIGNPTGDIRVSAMVNNSDHNYLSNQFLGGLAAPQGNLGGDGAGAFTGSLSGIDLTTFAGNQFFVVTNVPETSSALLGALGLLGILRRRR
jgi:hypothetical protein